MIQKPSKNEIGLFLASVCVILIMFFISAIAPERSVETIKTTTNMLHYDVIHSTPGYAIRVTLVFGLIAFLQQFSWMHKFSWPKVEYPLGSMSLFCLSVALAMNLFFLVAQLFTIYAFRLGPEQVIKIEMYEGIMMILLILILAGAFILSGLLASKKG